MATGLANEIWGASLDIPGLGADDRESVWIVVPGKHRQSLLRRAIRAAGLAPRIRVMVQSALDRVIGESLGLRGRALSDEQTHALLAWILEDSASELPALHELIPATKSQEHIVPGVAVRLREMLDYLRLNESEHLLLERSADDETGEIREERATTFELHQVLEIYEQWLEAKGWQEPISLRRRVAEALDADGRPRDLPDVLVLDQPSHLYPLETRIWSALARLVPTHLVVDSSVERLSGRLEGPAASRGLGFESLEPAKLPPSERHIGPLASWLGTARRRLARVHGLADPSPDSDLLIRALFDGVVPTSAESDSVVVWREHDRRREVERVVRTVKWGILQGELGPEDVHIVAPYLDPYLPLLRRAFADAGIPCSLPKGEPLWGSPPAAVLRAALRWVATGSSEDMLGYFGSRGVRRPKLDVEQVRSFCSRFRHLLPPLKSLRHGHGATDWSDLLMAQATGSLVTQRKTAESAESAENADGKNTKNTKRSLLNVLKIHSLQPFRLDAEARRARVRGGPDFEADWLVPMLAHLGSRLASVEHGEREESRLVGVIADLAVLERVWSRMRRLSAPDLDPLEGLRLLRSSLRKADAISGMVRRKPSATSLPPSLTASRPPALPTSLPHSLTPSLTQEMANTSRALGGIARLWREVEELVRFRQDELGIRDRGLASVRNFLFEALRGTHLARDPQPGSVVATELLDTRTERYRLVFVLGLSQTDFPPREIENYLVPEGLPRHLARPLDRGQEAVWLLGRLLRNASRVVLSCPRYSEDGVAQPAAPLEDLTRWRRQGRLRLAELDAPPASWVASVPELARRSWLDERIPGQLRDSIHASVTALAARKQPSLTAHDGAIEGHSLVQQVPRRYSVSELEGFVECPHRYFFSRVLGLETVTSIPTELEQNRTGTLVHQALERFFGDGPWHGVEIGPANFDDACAAMLATAQAVLRDSEVDWDSSPILQAQRHEILLGLDEPGDAGKRGFLKAALAFQRDFIRSVPARTELAFGHGDAPPLRLPGEIEIRGTVDRVDFDVKELRVWDYKTGGLPRVDAEGSLQIPLYAEAALRMLAPAGFESPRVRGGFIALARRNQHQKLDHPIHGAVVEALAIDRGSKGWALAPSASAGRIADALAAVQDLDRRIRHGEFHQLEETPEPVCARCDYRSICERDVARLRDKLAAATESAREVLAEGSLTGLESSPTELATAQGVTESPTAAPPAAHHSPLVIRHSPFALTEEQERASDIAQSVILTAGAGSGKTFVLMTRVCRLVAAGVPIESILAITFTRKAAEEVRNRISAALGEALERAELDGKPLTEAQRLALVDARARLPQATVTTIHGLCQQILRMDPILSGADDRARVLEDVHLTELQGLAVDHVLSSIDGPADLVVRVLTSGVSLRDLRAGVKRLIADQGRLQAVEESMLGRSDAAWRDLLDRLHGEQADRTGERLEKQLRDWLQAFEVWTLQPDPFGRSPENLDDRERLHHQVAEGVRDLVRGAAESGWASQFEGIERLVQLLDQRRDAQLRATAGRRNLWKELREILDGVDRVGLALDWQREQAGLGLARDVCAIALAALERYLQLKSEGAAIDYDDQLSRAHRMLCVPSPNARLRSRQRSVTQRLSKRYRHILVDEFQDTDARQWDILRAFAGDKAVDEGLTMFLVGDRKQAIYGFRGGENRVFEEARQVLTERGAVNASLRDNYRSQPRLIEVVNALFQPLFSSEFEGGDPSRARLVETAVAPEPMRAARKSDGDPGTVSLLGLPYGGRGEQKVREAALVASLVRAALEGSIPQYRDLSSAREDEPRIGILCRQTRDLVRTARALDREGVHYTVSHGSGFFQLSEVRALENLLRSLTDSRNLIAMAGVLRGPLFGWSDRDLADARQALGRGWLDTIRRGEWNDSRGQQVYTVFNRWRRAASVCSTSALLSLVVAETGMAAAFEATGNPGAASNIEKLIDLVYREERSLGRTGLVEVIRWFELQRSASEGAAIPPGIRTTVTLMTVHGAKGLEFPMVVLPFLESWGHDDRDFVISELPQTRERILGIQAEDAKHGYRRRATFLSQLAASTETRKGTSELKRLFYVACTRAQRHLVLTLSESADFWGAQRRRDALGEESRREKLAHGRDPRTWLTHLLGSPAGDGSRPGEMSIHEEQVRIPILWPEAIPARSPRPPVAETSVALDTTGLFGTTT